MDNNGQTAADLKQTLANADKISGNLEKFTAILANKDQDLDLLINDAHQTMQAIKAAADNVNQAVKELTTGDGTLSQVKETISQASQAATKVNDYVSKIEQIQLKNSIGARYQNGSDSQLEMVCHLDLNLNQKNSLLIGWDGIGQDNLASLQWGFKYRPSDQSNGCL